MSTRRINNWEVALSRFFDQRVAQPFEWGVSDCAMLAADAVLTITGVDLAADLRGTYHDEAEAMAVLEPFGGLAGFVSTRLAECGFAEVPIKLAQRGDVVLLEVQGRQMLGVVAMDGSYVALQDEQRLRWIPALACARAWRVG